ncbi:energy transducer TonB [Abyssalbus ytuae]|uniref:Energy transducer TonB n=1 Tax=Abyssalbus ytuae TaxID=2926907 RepID=A0A9E6ZR59_9FLAO|nr:energy transducer TonB [Abyssalbus ytuae]UOB18980.1 energy transducer TonB [Abyssalbus ytuae]
MKFKMKSFNAHGNEHKTRKPSKHDANLRKNNLLHFQLGLLISLIVTFFVFQLALREQPIEKPEVAQIDFIEEPYVVTDFKKYVEPKKEQSKEKITPRVKKSYQFTIGKDDEVETKKQLFSQDELDEPGNLDLDNIIYVKKTDDPVLFDKVEFVPVFPGCESLSSNEERKECMSDKISKIVRKNFRTDRAIDFGLTGTQRIYVQFTINKQGLVSDVKIKAPHKVLEEEALRVTKLIPQMKPGKQQDREVEVVFMKPIVFKVQ